MFRTLTFLLLMVLPETLTAQEIKLPEGLGDLSIMMESEVE